MFKLKTITLSAVAAILSMGVTTNALAADGAALAGGCARVGPDAPASGPPPESGQGMKIAKILMALCLLLLSTAPSRAQESVCYGTTSNGALENACRMPRNGAVTVSRSVSASRRIAACNGISQLPQTERNRIA